MKLISHVAWVCALAWTISPLLNSTAAEPNQLTDAEKKAGWKLLFDGQTLNGWRGFKKTAPPVQGWEVTNGVLTCVARGKGGDLITAQTFDNFELSWEWKMPPKSNNGVKYFITEERNAAIGHEYQLIDDTLVKNPLSSTASFYLIVAPKPDKKVKPSGEWNQSRVLVQGNHVEHWLNGEKALEYECGTDAILEQVAKTKFKNTPDFGKKIRGHILLTYHNDECSFRNIKIRDLAAK
jgi:3-keto-disaccharide hydrolase